MSTVDQWRDVPQTDQEAVFLALFERQRTITAAIERWKQMGLIALAEDAETSVKAYEIATALLAGVVNKEIAVDGILSTKDKETGGKERIAELEQQLKEREERLQIDPGGSDKIDELEQAIQFMEHRYKTRIIELESAVMNVLQWLTGGMVNENHEIKSMLLHTMREQHKIE